MSKRVRSLIIVIAVVAVITLAIALLFWYDKKNPDSSLDSSDVKQDTSEVLISKSKDSDGNIIDNPVKKAVIKTKSENFTIASGKNDVLCVQTYKDLPVATSAIGSFVETVSEFTVSQKIHNLKGEGIDKSNNESQTQQLTESDFGLDKPSASIKVDYYDGKSHTIYIGDVAPTEEGSYVRIDDSDDIYLMDSYAASTLTQGSTQYIGVTLMTPPEVEAATSEEQPQEAAVLYDIQLGGTSRKQTLKLRPYLKDSDNDDLSLYTYIMYEPVKTGTNMDTSSFASSMASYNSLNATKVVKAYPTADDKKLFGLDNPFSTAQIKLAVQKIDGDNNAKYSKISETYKFMLGKKDADGMYYLMCEGIDVVYAIDASSVPWATVSKAELQTGLAYLFDIKTVKSITTSVDGKSTTFEIRHFKDEDENDEIEITANGKKLDDDNFRTLYQVFMSPARKDDSFDKPTGTPWVKLDVKRNDKKLEDSSISYYKKNATYAVCVDAVGDEYTVLTSDVNWLIKQVENYIAGKDVSTG